MISNLKIERWEDIRQDKKLSRVISFCIFFKIFKDVLDVERLVNKKYSNPIRSVINKNERTPSSYVYYNRDLDEFCYKDFSSGKHYTYISFLKDVVFLDDNFYSSDDSLGYVIDAVLLTISSGYDHILDVLYSMETTNNTKKPSLDYKKENPVLVEIKELSDTELKYLYQYKIEDSVLKKYDVMSISKLFYKDLFISKDMFPNEPLILYTYKCENILCPFQLYRPYEKKFRFLNVVSYKSLYGLKTKASSSCFIFGSIKDMLSFESACKREGIEIDVFSTISETSYSSTLFNDIEFVSSYSKCFVFYDNDETGIKSVKDLYYKAKSEGLDNIVPVNPKILGNNKDVADFFLNGGEIKSILNDIKKQINKI